jgi:hypothetical protein
VSIAFTSSFLNDLGELDEIVYEGGRISSTGAVEVVKGGMFMKA